MSFAEGQACSVHTHVGSFAEGLGEAGSWEGIFAVGQTYKAPLPVPIGHFARGQAKLTP
jgi:hypothetical protein